MESNVAITGEQSDHIVVFNARGLEIYALLLPDFTIAAISPRFANLLKLEKEKLLGCYLPDVLSCDAAKQFGYQPDELLISLKRVLENKVEDTMKMQAGLSSSTNSHTESGFFLPTNKPITDTKEQVIYIAHFLEDVNEYEQIKNENKRLSDKIAFQQKTEEELKKYKFFFDTGYNLATIASFEGYFEIINPQFEQVLGYSQTELLTNKFFSFVHPDDLADTINEIETLKTGVTTFTFTNRYRKKNGDYVWLEWISSIPDVPTGKIYAIARDITERRNAEMNLKLKSEELISANKELEQFAYVASHDLQEPLRTISNYINLLQEEYNKPLNENLERYLHFITQATTKMQQLIKDLLDFSRIGNMVSFTSINCNNILQEVIGELGIAIKEAGATIHSCNLPVLIGNEIGLKQLFQNLISNAIKFTKKNVCPELYIGVEESDNEFLFAFKDNGIGIDEQFKDRIFIIFQRLHTADEYPGTGIGLANCNKIVALHLGKIGVSSQPGCGSTFYFTISKKIKASQL